MMEGPGKRGICRDRTGAKARVTEGCIVKEDTRRVEKGSRYWGVGATGVF